MSSPTTQTVAMEIVEAVVAAYRTHGWSLRIAPIASKKRPRMLVLDDQ